MTNHFLQLRHDMLFDPPPPFVGVILNILSIHHSIYAPASGWVSIVWYQPPVGWIIHPLRVGAECTDTFTMEFEPVHSPSDVTTQPLRTCFYRDDGSEQAHTKAVNITLINSMDWHRWCQDMDVITNHVIRALALLAINERTTQNMWACSTHTICSSSFMRPRGHYIWMCQRVWSMWLCRFAEPWYYSTQLSSLGNMGAGI
jgi:hypothetical protein